MSQSRRVQRPDRESKSAAVVILGGSLALGGIIGANGGVLALGVFIIILGVLSGLAIK